MSTIRTSARLDLDGNLSRQARRFGSDLEQLHTRGGRALSRLGGVASATGRALDRLGNRYTALLTGAAGVGALRAVGQHEERLVRLGIQANVAEGAIARLNQRVYEIARQKDVRLGPDKILDAVDEIVEKTGDLKFAEENLRNIGLAIRATGAAGRDVGGILAEFQKMGIRAPADVMKALDILNVQGKEGAFTLQQLAALGPRVVTAYTAMGRTGVPAIREMGAALQMIRMGTGSSEMAATAFEALIRTLGEPEKLKLLQKGGIQVFDPRELARGREVLRPINQLLEEIVTKAKGRKTVLGQIFDAEAIRAFNQALGEYKRTGAIESLDRFMNVQADGTATTLDAARAAKTAAASMELLRASWLKFADAKLTGPLQKAAELLDRMTSADIDRWLSRLTTGAGVLGGLVVAKKGFDLVGSFRGAMGKGAGTTAGGLPLPLPVYIVNRHMSLTPDAWTGAGGAGVPGVPGGAPAGRIGRALRTAGAVTSVGAAFAGAYELVSAANRNTRGFPVPATDEAARRQVLGVNGGRPPEATVTLKIEGAPVRTRSIRERGITVNVDAGPTFAGGN